MLGDDHGNGGDMMVTLMMVMGVTMMVTLMMVMVAMVTLISDSKYNSDEDQVRCKRGCRGTGRARRKYTGGNDGGGRGWVISTCKI